MTDKWKALERLRERAAGGNHADEDCNIINLAFRDLEQKFFDAIKDNAEVARLNADLAVANIALEQRMERLTKFVEMIEGGGDLPNWLQDQASEALAAEEEA